MHLGYVRPYLNVHPLGLKHVLAATLHVPKARDVPKEAPKQAPANNPRIPHKIAASQKKATQMLIIPTEPNLHRNAHLSTTCRHGRIASRALYRMDRFEALTSFKRNVTITPLPFCKPLKNPNPI